MQQQTIYDWLAAILTLGALAIGLASMAVGRYMVWRDRRAARHAPTHKRRRNNHPARRWKHERPRALVRIPLEPAEPLVVRAQQNQVEPIEPGTIEPAFEPTQLYRLSLHDEIVLLAVQRDERGAYRHSANAITKFVGGTAAEVKKIVADVRGTAPEKVQPPRSSTRPARGWG